MTKFLFGVYWETMYIYLHNVGYTFSYEFMACKPGDILFVCFKIGLAYCRHLSTVRTHLSALVNGNIIEHDFPTEAKGGLSLEVWNAFLQDSSVRPKSQQSLIKWDDIN